MEGAGIFNLAGNGQGDASMLYGVHTRNIVDPIVGAKFTGTAGPMTFGTLTALDQGPGHTEDEADPLHGKDKLFQVGRAQVALKKGSYAGGIFTLTEIAGRTNIVSGADVRFQAVRLAEADGVRARVFDDGRHEPAGSRSRRGRDAGQLLLRDEEGQLRHAVRALRPRLRDGHRLPEPRRLHGGLGVRRPQLLPGQGPASLAPPRVAVRVPRGWRGPRRRRGRVRRASPAFD